jgi:Tol biopolymer transport system component
MRTSHWAHLSVVASTLAMTTSLLVGCGSSQDSNSGVAPPPRSTNASPKTPKRAAGVLLPGTVLFTSTTGNDVSTVLSLTHGVEKVITEPGEFGGVALSPDRKLLLGMPGGDAGQPVRGVTARMSDGALTPLRIPDRSLNLVPSAWSPDGHQILYLGWDDSSPKRTGIYVADYPTGAHLRAILLRPGELQDEPIAFSPDGGQVLFYRAAAPDPDPHLNGSLWVVPTGGGAPRKISHNVQPYDSAAWSPDGRRIVFATTRLQPHGSIWTVAPGGTGLTEVTRDPAGGYPVTPTWSPDGKRILFGLDKTNDDWQHIPNVIYVMDADGSHLQRVRADNHGGIMRSFNWVR